MSTHVYNRYPGIPAPPRRPPFASINRTNLPPPPARPPSPKSPERVKQPSSPPLPRQNSKAVPPSPPSIIRDKARSVAYTRVGFLGEGGFARVFEVKDAQGKRHACKVVTKNSLKTKKAKTKLYAEIKIHRSLEHPNIVTFEECFEDDDNVYMTLELCHSGSLMDMLRRRRRFSEPESRFFMIQLLGACHYMHTNQVIHRDLKLGNLFLDANMNVKVGDFGLAALIESPGERKKTICGTPNYIAPEVLFDTANGHSFEVDTWSIGVILYTLVVGRPPFQTKDVKEIYKRIRDNEYEFPTEREISLPARDLITNILAPDPQERPTLHEILDSPFFTQGTVPGYIPSTAHDRVPDFRHISRAASQSNLARLRKLALLDEDQTPALGSSITNANLSRMHGNMGTSIAQQEREFHQAVQPGSPISALLSSARQPLLVSTKGARESPLMRKLQAAAKESKSPGRGGALHNIQEEDGTAVREKHDAESRRKELESQKARIVAQMAPRSATSEDRENQPLKVEAKMGKVRENVPLRGSTNGALSTKLNTFEVAEQTLTAAFEAKAVGKVFRDPSADVGLVPPKVFIVSWVDYCNKYGMGYALTDGTVGVHFNDSTSMLLSPDKHHIDYVTSRRQGTVYVRKNYTVSEYPEDIKSKVYLLKHFERYIMDRLYGEYGFTFEDLERTKGMDFVQKYLRMKQVIIFKMSHDILQFNFFDHAKLMLSSNGLHVTHIDKDYKVTHWTLSEIMARALNPQSSDADVIKFNQGLVDKLKYCKEVLLSINTSPVAPAGP